mmetsp:Transcript_54764/g.100793  ORF Transcript_54764/g.100793 Transcript_54764/m.100793 type:complete len:704 (-) Transcript_54764:153-2264(-)
MPTPPSRQQVPDINQSWSARKSSEGPRELPCVPSAGDTNELQASARRTSQVSFDLTEDVDRAEDFTRVATKHVQFMLDKLLVEYQSSICSLQSEIQSLRKKPGKVRHAAEPVMNGAKAEEQRGEGCDLNGNTEQQEEEASLLKQYSHFWEHNNTAPEQESSPERETSPKEETSPEEEETQCAEENLAEDEAIVQSEAETERTYSKHKDRLFKSWSRWSSASRMSFDVPAPKKKESWRESLRRHLSPKEEKVNRMPSVSSDKKRHSLRIENPSRVQGFVLSNAFEIVSGGAILLNTIVMCLQAQYDGYNLGHTMIRPTMYTEDAFWTWTGAQDLFNILDIVFNVMFCVELVLRAYTYGTSSFRMAWMWFDTIIVSLGLVDMMMSGGIGIDPTILRLVRVVRLIRLLKIFKAMSSFDSLFLLVKAITASVQALLWSFLLLLLVQMGTALFLCQVLHGFIEDKDKNMEARDKVFAYFGTFYRAMLTMFEITLANWVPSCRTLVEEVNEMFFLFYLVYRCMFCFAVLKVIAAVFISETNRVLASDAELTLMKVQREKLLYTAQLKSLLSAIDSDHDKTITWPEMQVFLLDQNLSAWLATVGMDRTDFEKLFWLIERDGVCDVDKFLSMIGQLKGGAKTVDLLNLFKVVHKIDKKVDKVFNLKDDLQEQAIYNLSEGAPERSNSRLSVKVGESASVGNAVANLSAGVK